MIVVPNSSPWKSLKEFIASAKANPGKINWASPGIGTSPHLAGELFKRVAGIEMTHVPYRGVAAGAMSDLIAGRLDAMFNTTGSLLQPVARLVESLRLEYYDLASRVLEEKRQVIDCYAGWASAHGRLLSDERGPEQRATDRARPGRASVARQRDGEPAPQLEHRAGVDLTDT